jgi:chorismate synthase
MPVLRWVTAGESHGPMLVGVLEGMPAGMPLAAKDLRPRMRRRQGGYGRGKRMGIEGDEPNLVAGTWKGVTTGAPIAVLIENRSNRAQNTKHRRTEPRPGHADLAGMLKYGLNDANPVLERASARETAMRTALGSIACLLLERLGVRLTAHVVAMGGVNAPAFDPSHGPEALEEARDRSDVACCDPDASERMMARVDEAAERRQTLGGRVELIAWNVPPGLGSFSQWDRRLDGRLAGALAAIPSVKEVELGDALTVGAGFGGEAHDVIERRGEGLSRATNRAGGLEAGVSNGEPVVARLTLKPIPTQRRPLPTVDVDTGEVVKGRYVRSDVAVVPAAAVIVEAVTGLVLADALLEKFGGDCVADLEGALQGYRARLPRWPARSAEDDPAPEKGEDR